MKGEDRRGRLVFAVAAAALAIMTVTMLCVALEGVFHFSGPAIDGPFQLYNALRRIHAGYRLGVDFQFFHGAAIPFLHYPMYWAFGEGIFASEFARQLISVVAFVVVLLLFF